MTKDKPDPKTPPGLDKKIPAVVAAVVRHFVAGRPVATLEEIRARLAICETCEYYDAEKNRCNACGCKLGIKTSWAEASCPLPTPKWGPITDP